MKNLDALKSSSSFFKFSLISMKIKSFTETSVPPTFYSAARISLISLSRFRVSSVPPASPTTLLRPINLISNTVLLKFSKTRLETQK